MSAIQVIGAQFGDEGKGKITDYYAKNVDIVVRYNGGNNAGHTVVVGDKKYKFHLLPSGMVRGKECMIASGVVLDPRVLDKELQNMLQLNPGMEVKLKIDPRCHIILPYHPLFDAVDEKKGKVKIGTTLRGIGPCYADKCDRIGIRFDDLVEPEIFKEKLKQVFPIKEKILRDVYGINVDFTLQEVFREYAALGEKFKHMLADVSSEIYWAIKNNKKIIFEGAQGTFLDNDFGTYPYVTSSHPISGALSIGVGIGPLTKRRIIGVVKAYSTRVGGGPFVTELKNMVGDRIREQGKEYGTTTGRPRRCGWLDLPMLRTSCMINGFTEIALTKLDVLSGLEGLKICTSYDYNGKELKEFPYNIRILSKCKPTYLEFEGFGSLEGVKKYEDLPEAATKYIQFVEDTLNVPIKLVSAGAERSQTFKKK